MLNRIVEIIEANSKYFDNFFKHKIYLAYKIAPINFNRPKKSLKDALKLYYFSLTTRQRTNKEPLTQTEREQIRDCVKYAIKELNNRHHEPKERYYNVIKTLNPIKGAGQKINTMFVKFLILHSRHLHRKNELLKVLWIPLDIHMIRFLFRYHNQKITKRFRLFNKNINNGALSISIKKNGEISERNQFFKAQTTIRRAFARNRITAPPIILDNLWVIGATRCVNTKFSGKISCDECIFNVQYRGEPICMKENLANN